MGVNNDKYDAAKHHIISIASCSTNCLAPVVMCCLRTVLELKRTYDDHSQLHGHAEKRTAHQRRIEAGRTAAVNIIPSTTGAAKVVASFAQRKR
jgi:glyceraldehyde 3-phosphate dehydrogenase